MFDKIICFLAKIDCKKVNPVRHDKLLRYPAQSLDEKIDDISSEFFTNLVAISAVMSIASIFLTSWFILLQLAILF